MTEYNKICRTCLVSLESTQYCIYENVSPHIYYFCTSIEVFINKKIILITLYMTALYMIEIDIQ